MGGGVQESVSEFGADFITCLLDRGTNGCANPASFGAKFNHRRNSGVEHTSDGAFPARMRRTNHARFGIGKQNRRAVGRQDAQGDSRNFRRHRIGLRAHAPRFGDMCDIG